MSLFALVAKNLFRRKLLAALMLFAVFVAFAMFAVLGSFQSMLALQDTGGDRRLIVFNKLSASEPLPLADVEEVRQVPGAGTASYSSAFVGYYQQRANPLAVFAVDPRTFLSVQRDDIALDGDAAKAFAADRGGAIIGEATAQRYGLHVGDRLPIRALTAIRRDRTSYWTVTIDGIYRGKSRRDDAIAVYIDYDFFNQSRLTGTDTVDMIWLLAAPQTDPDALARAIDSRFANSPAETQTVGADEFARALLAQLGNVSLVIWLVAAAGFVTILLIVANTMMTSFRERRREFAVLKAVGYAPGTLLRLILGEALLLAVLGGLPGLAAGAVFTQVLRDSGNVLFQRLAMNPIAVLGGLTAIAALGVLGGLWPAVSAATLRPAVVLARA